MSIFKILGCCSLGETASKRRSSEAAYAAVQEPLGLSCRVSSRVASLKTGTELNMLASRNWLESVPRLQQCAPQQRRRSPQPESRDLGWCSALVLLACGGVLTCNPKIAGESVSKVASETTQHRSHPPAIELELRHVRAPEVPPSRHAATANQAARFSTRLGYLWVNTNEQMARKTDSTRIILHRL